MADEKTNLRLVQSRSVLSAWERMGGPTGRPVDVLRMIGEEIAELERIVAAYPEKSDTVGDLIKRYRALQGRVRESATH